MAGSGWFTREVSIGGDAAPGQRLSNGQALEESPSKLEVTNKVTGWTTRKTCTLIAASLLVAMVTSMGFTAGTLMVLLETGYLTSPGALNRVCVPCDALKISSDPVDDLSRGFEKEDDMCCTRNSTQLQLIIRTVSHVARFNQRC